VSEQLDDSVLMSRYRFLLHQCRPRHEAADVFQEVWSRVIKSRERYEVRASFRTYLYSIAHRCVIDYHRMRGRKRMDRTDALDGFTDSLSTPAHEQPDAQAAHAQMEDAFQQALADLPEEQLSVFLLFEESGLGLKEIAEVTGAPTETVKSRLRYALAKLRRGLAPSFEMAGLNPASVQP
jgi:RNA polymerase sigma-70 factor (ECF subfamily)